ncbi:MAG: phenylalanine--tRNA ligase beta subunit-related protein [Bacteroidaceae bacterium]|nr:phenylalanine--tRNA ligase beta subunit-related protein [Bacteroidaceae bacterium]
MKIHVDEHISRVCPTFVGAALSITITNSTYCPALWEEINSELEAYRRRFTTESIKDMPSIQATRRIYKALGKDPSRYRPSGEALVRRTLQGKDLYQIDTAVDLINLASITYGYSIGGFDADKIEGEELTLSVGHEGEPYEGIGRGPVNICSLPVYRDSMGGIGTPTTDHERTKLSLSTTHLLAIVNGYDGNREQVELCVRCIQTLAERYAEGRDGHTIWF